MNATLSVSWQTVALVGLTLAALCVLAYLDRSVTAAIVGALGTLAAGASPQLLQRATGDAPKPPGAA